ncbi:MAG: hypothetical protein PV362_15660, partial [Providencia heimbachae]|nr:hypothetical protein [Providencia heimbachae]
PIDEDISDLFCRLFSWTSRIEPCQYAIQQTPFFFILTKPSILKTLLSRQGISLSCALFTLFI